MSTSPTALAITLKLPPGLRERCRLSLLRRADTGPISEHHLRLYSHSDQCPWAHRTLIMRGDLLIPIPSHPDRPAAVASLTSSKRPLRTS